MDLISIINHHFEELSSQDKAILGYLEAASCHLNEITSQGLAEACFVSRSSVFRLIKKLGLDSFSELKYLVQKQKEANSHQQESNFYQVADKYHVYIDQIFKKLDLRKPINQLLKAEVLYLYGTGNEQKLEVETLRQLFTSIGKKVIVFFDKGEYDFIKSGVTDNDLLILVSYKGESQEGIDILKDSRVRAIKSLVFTRTSRNTMAQLADYCLYVPTESISTPTRLTYEVSTTFYFIIDQLFFDYLEELEGKGGQ